MSTKTKALIEHYLIAVAVTAVGIWQTGTHELKNLAWATVIALGAPVLKGAYEHATKPAGRK